MKDSYNCHLYYICEKVDTWAGRSYWTYYHVSCGLLFWDQSRLTCTEMVPPDCEMKDGVPELWDENKGGMYRQVNKL